MKARLEYFPGDVTPVQSPGPDASEFYSSRQEVPEHARSGAECGIAPAEPQFLV
jgi:hypothetical protein